MTHFILFRVVPSFLFLIASILIKPIIAVAASTPIDSLQQALINHPGEDTIRAKILLELARLWHPENLDSMAKYNELAFDLSERIGFNHGLMRSLNGKALINWRKQQFQEAISCFHKSIAYGLLEQNNDYLSIMTNNIGVLYGNLGRVDSAGKYHELALAYGIRANNPLRVAKAKMDLSGLAGYKGDYAGAIRHLLDAQKIYENNHNLDDLFRVYLRLGIQYAHLRDFSSSRFYYKKAERV
ncbi:MAG: tetratricopeptide repeat protein, partial [Bacteroidales bacterium]|nr:tetratricopeptide repeat protein [Bacteroidales bacterium]